MWNGLKYNKTRDTMKRLHGYIMTDIRVSDKRTHKDGRINIDLLGTSARSPRVGRWCLLERKAPFAINTWQIHEEWYLLSCDALYSGRIMWDFLRRLWCLEVTQSTSSEQGTEKSVNVYQTVRHQVAVDKTLKSHHHEKIKSNNLIPCIFLCSYFIISILFMYL
jgi:hypothetical protein